MSDHGHGPKLNTDGLSPALKSAAAKLSIKDDHHGEAKAQKQVMSTGVLTQASKQVFGQMIRADYLNEFIELWREDYVAKARCACFLAAAVVSWNALPPFSLLCVALAAKYWDWATWNRNIPRFNGAFRNVALMQ